MLLNGKYLSFRTLRIMALCKIRNLWSSSLQPICLLPWSTRCNQLPPLSWGFYTHLSPDIRQHCHILSRALLWSSKTRPLAMETSQEKGIQQSSVIFTAPPVALLAPSWKKHKLFCTMSSVSALDSGSPDHLRIAVHPSGSCSHLPDHCHPHCQAQAFTKLHQQPPHTISVGHMGQPWSIWKLSSKQSLLGTSVCLVQTLSPERISTGLWQQ